MSKLSDIEMSFDDPDSLQTTGESSGNNRGSLTFMDSGNYKMMESTDELYFLALIDENKQILCSRCNTPEFKYTRVSIWDSITRQLSKQLGRPLLSEKVQRRWNNIQQRMKTNFSKQLTRFTDLYGQIDPESITLESLSLSKNDKLVLEILGFENIKHALCFPNSGGAAATNSARNSSSNSNPILEARLQEQSSSCGSTTPVIKLEDSPNVICADTYQPTSSSTKNNEMESQQPYSRSHISASYTDSQRLSQMNNHHIIETNNSPTTIIADHPPYHPAMSQMRENELTYPIRGLSMMNEKGRRSTQFNFGASSTASQLFHNNSGRDICTFEELDIMRKKLEFKKLQLEVDNLELEKERRKLEIEVLRRQLQNDDNSVPPPPSKRFRIA